MKTWLKKHIINQFLNSTIQCLWDQFIFILPSYSFPLGNINKNTFPIGLIRELKRVQMAFHVEVLKRFQLTSLKASLVAQLVKNLPTLQETWVQSLGWEDPWGREWQPTPVFLPGELHGQRNLVGYRPCSHEESDTTKWLITFMFS